MKNAHLLKVFEAQYFFRLHIFLDFAQTSRPGNKTTHLSTTLHGFDSKICFGLTLEKNGIFERKTDLYFLFSLSDIKI